ncbi:MAG: 3'-5' exonuclease [Kiritimatiellae bacterium]|nr:3'-5' exonuclease [Kiritimatiellia bacterium]MDD5520389.1 3'-5' exonuclease [Kiritimatiellia bacterium]
MNRSLKFVIILMIIFSFPMFIYCESLTNTFFVAFDLETTGFSSLSDRIVEIAAIKFKNGVVVEGRKWLINPGIPIPESAVNVHGITDKMVRKCPSFKDTLPEFAAFIEKSILVAHNAEFDMRFIMAETQRNNFVFPENIVIDNLKLARRSFPDAGSYDLKSLADRLGIDEGKSHRALSDSRTLMKVFIAGLKKFPSETSLEQLIEIADTQNRKKRIEKSVEKQSR